MINGPSLHSLPRERENVLSSLWLEKHTVERKRHHEAYAVPGDTTVHHALC
jgi:hypothetical protein